MGVCKKNEANEEFRMPNVNRPTVKNNSQEQQIIEEPRDQISPRDKIKSSAHKRDATN